MITERFQRVGKLPVESIGGGITARTLVQQQARYLHVQRSLVSVHDVSRIPGFSVGILTGSANVPASGVGGDHSQVFGFESFQAQNQVLVHGVIAATVAAQTRDGNVIGTFGADVGIGGLTVEITQVTTAHETDSGSFQRNWRNLYRIAFLIDGASENLLQNVLDRTSVALQSSGRAVIQGFHGHQVASGFCGQSDIAVLVLGYQLSCQRANTARGVFVIIQK